ncbi:MAG: amine dehydrogenase large subunit [Pseudomonadota bacterium]
MQTGGLKKARVSAMMGVLLSWGVSSASAEIAPEVMGKSTMGEPTPTWLMVHDAVGPAYVFDSATGDMQGLLSLSGFTPAVVVNLAEGRAYAAESFYSRGVRGVRTDVLTIYDLPTLSPVGEVEIPQKIAALPFPQYIEMLDDERHVAVFNLTPGMSVSIIDVEDQEFVDEISTPGCALMMAVAERGFLQLCGDGAVQLIRLGRNGKEIERIRSDAFFSLEDDPVFDKPVQTSRGWLLTSYHGLVYEVEVDGGEISISEPWPMLSEADREADWLPGGGQLVAFHQEQDLIFILMNQDGEFAQDSPGTQVWVYNREAQQRVAQIPLTQDGTNLFVSQDEHPLLTVTGVDAQLHIFDVKTLKQVRTISEVGVAPGLLQGF